MKKIAFVAVMIAAPAAISAQSAINAYQLSQSDLRGTARFMSMGGAFGALGGDLSTLNQNPAGIGVYRTSEIGVTVDFNMTSSNVDGVKDDKTHVYCNNFGYIGSVSLDNDIMPYFQWGATYSRVASFDRTYSGGFGSLGTSMSNYVANFSNGYAPDVLGQSSDYNPYDQSNADWMSILAYNADLIKPVGSSSYYNGLFNEGVTTGNSEFSVRERGYVDEYSINFGGNIMNTVYWGMGFGITDIGFTQEAFYDEELKNANIASGQGNTGTTTDGNAYFALSNYRHVTGTGFNFKIGAIVKPINELRLGIAVHTPTYYSLTDSYDAAIGYSYSSNVGDGSAYTNYAYYDWKLRTPWKLIASAAGVVGGRFILSADYEYDAYDNMRVSDGGGYEYKDVTDDIKYYFKPTNTVRIGAEFRVTPSFSVRAGFANTSSAMNSGVNEGDEYIYTSGTNPAYTFDTSTRYITCGIGYRYKGFYADAAYVNKHRKSTYHPFSSYEDAYGWMYGPYADFTTDENNIVISLGYKF